MEQEYAIISQSRSSPLRNFNKRTVIARNMNLEDAVQHLHKLALQAAADPDTLEPPTLKNFDTLLEVAHRQNLYHIKIVEE